MQIGTTIHSGDTLEKRGGGGGGGEGGVSGVS